MNAPPFSVLIADDHALVRDMLAQHLEREPGISLVGATADAGEALALAEHEKPDVVVLDIDMPGLSAFEAARKIASSAPRARIVFLSGYLNDAYIEQALALEAGGYISKSEPVDAIVRAIRKVAGGSLYFSPQVQQRIVVDGNGVRLRSGPHARLQLLTPREMEILGYLAKGLAKKEMARLADISVKTVDQHCTHIMEKLDIHDRVELAHFAIREGLVEP
jgi:DNA-binding NarL/FixJ family response regulator